MVMVYPQFQRILKERIQTQMQLQKPMQKPTKVDEDTDTDTDTEGPDDYVKLFCICFRMESFMNSLQNAQLNTFYKELDTLFALFQHRNPETTFRKEEAMRRIDQLQHNVPEAASRLAQYIMQFHALKEAFFNFSQKSLTPYSSPIHMYESDGL